MDRSKRRLVEELMAYDPGLGPMTPATMGGRPNAELRQGDLTEPPSTVQTMLDYGSFPARAWTDQLHNTADAVSTAYSDPTIATLTNAGLQTGISAGSPLVAAGSLALGYGAAGASDLLGSMVSPANADASRMSAIDAEMAKLTKQRDQLTAQTQRGNTNARNRAERALQGLNAQMGTLAEERRALAEADAAARARQQEEADKVAAEERRRFAEQEAAAFGRANTAAARDNRFSDSSLKDVYDATGGNVPLAFGAAMLPGFINRMAGRGKNYFRDGLEGAAAAFSVNSAPDAYDMIMAPTMNPEYERASILARELPEGHDQRAMYEEQERTMREAGLIENPIKATARENFFDPDVLGKRALISALEGAAGPIGYNLPGAVQGAIRGVGAAPGQLRAGYLRGQTSAELERARFNRAKAQADAASRSKKGDRPDQPDRPDDPGGGGRGGDRSGGRDRNRETGGGGGGGSGGDGGKKDKSTRGPRGPAYTDEARAAARGYLADRVEAGGNNITREGLEEAITSAGQRVPQGFDNMADRTIKFLNAVEHAGGRVDRNTIMNMPTTLGRGAPLLGVPLAVGALSDEEQRRALIQALSE